VNFYEWAQCMAVSGQSDGVALTDGGHDFLNSQRVIALLRYGFAIVSETS
jgi:hypothetical protein